MQQFSRTVLPGTRSSVNAYLLRQVSIILRSLIQDIHAILARGSGLAQGRHSRAAAVSSSTSCMSPRSNRIVSSTLAHVPYALPRLQVKLNQRDCCIWFVFNFRVAAFYWCGEASEAVCKVQDTEVFYYGQKKKLCF